MVALKDFKQGEIIMAEPLLLLVSNDEVSTNLEVLKLSTLYPSIDPQLFAYYCIYKRQMPDIQQRINDFYSGVDMDPHNPLRLRIHADLSNEDLNSDLNVEEFVQIAMIFHYNGAEVTPPPPDGSSDSIYLGIGLFPYACRISHSCDTACCVL